MTDWVSPSKIVACLLPRVMLKTPSRAAGRESEWKVGRSKDVRPRSRLPRPQDDLIRPTEQVGQGDPCL
jgi:hypothetical protein